MCCYLGIYAGFFKQEKFLCQNVIDFKLKRFNRRLQIAQQVEGKKFITSNYA